MEETGEIHSEDNKSLPDKNKRKLKTPFQVESLEKLYCEHKYPSEQMKSQLVETIGLTEKQVSGWFCHRRLKDKRLSVGETYDNIRQDRSSGVIQDRGSGHRQDSCGSRQEGDNNKHFDLKEVESKRSSGGGGGQVFSVADCIPKYMVDNDEDDTDMDDDTSSGSSLPLQHRYLPNNPKSFSSMETSRYIRHNKNIVPGDSTKMQVTRPSGYLKMKVPIENPAITAVKRQLDRHYCEDGPPLGVNFDLLPPGAFESSTLNHDNEEYDDPEDQLTPKTEYLGIKKQPESGMMHETYNCKTNLQNMDLDMTRSKFIQGSDYEECYNSSKLAKPKNLSHNISSFSGNNSSSQGGEAYYSGDISPYDDRIPDRMKIQIHKERRMNVLPENYVKKVYAKTEPSFSQKDGPNNKRPLIPTNGVPLDMDDDDNASRKMNKEGGLYSVNRAKSGYYSSVPPNEMKVIKRDHADHPQHQRKASSSKASAWIRMPKRSAVDQVPSSFSEDETALTSSS